MAWSCTNGEKQLFSQNLVMVKPEGYNEVLTREHLEINFEEGNQSNS